jgi:hypothetical protein
MSRPEGDPPKATEKCPLCGAPPNVPHSSRCPWIVWAGDPLYVAGDKTGAAAARSGEVPDA